MKRLLFITLGLFLSAGVGLAYKDLERGDILRVFERFIEGSASPEEAAVIKELGSQIEVEAPPYIKEYTKGLLQELRGNKEKALEHFLKSIELKSDYNPAYYRFNELIRSVDDPTSYRERITEVIKKRFKSTPPVILNNPPDKYILLVEKMSQYLLVYRGKELVGLYPITTGANWGDKWVEGDKKTPEGLYYFTRFIPPSQLPAIYGGIAVVLNYPNPVDKLWGKGGSGIWLHGSNETDREKIPFSTRGCVVADNESLRGILKFIKLNNTLIGIYKTLPTHLETEDIKEFLQRWKESWENKDLEGFLSFYSDKFRWKGGGFKEWKRYKRRVILGKKYIKVNIKDITALAFAKEGKVLYYLVEFTQEYESDSYRDKGVKRLYILKEGDNIKDVKIVFEGFIHGGKR